MLIFLRRKKLKKEALKSKSLVRHGCTEDYNFLKKMWVDMELWIDKNVSRYGLIFLMSRYGIMDWQKCESIWIDIFNGSGRVTLVFFLIRSESDLFKLRSNFFDPYPIRSGHGSTRSDRVMDRPNPIRVK
jgi:hypothetical protein